MKALEKFLNVVGNEITEHFSDLAGASGLDDFDLDEGDIQVIEHKRHKIVLGLFERDENGETTDKEICRVAIVTIPDI